MKIIKTLILNGSPRAKGDGKYIIEKLQGQLNGSVHVIDVYKEEFSPCIDCRYCWTNCKCSINDDMTKLYESIDTFDNIVISSPVYFSELSGPLLSYTSRFQRYYAEKYLMKDHTFEMKVKKGAVILTAGGDCRSIQRPIDTAEIILSHINTKIIGTISTMNTNVITPGNDISLRSQIKTVSKLLNMK